MAARELISTMTFLKSIKSSEPFSREILDLEQKIKIILYLCTIGYGTTYGIKKINYCENGALLKETVRFFTKKSPFNYL